MAIQDIIEAQSSAVMPLVRFERRAVEDKAASRAAGHYVAKDVDYALVTPPYSKDVMHHKLPNWFEQLELDAQKGRVPREWVAKVKLAYDFFKRGQEIPLEGVPIKGWGVISPAQQETLIKLNILTVETLAAANDEGLRRIGMGAIELKHKAEAWLKQLKKAGPATQEIAALKTENEHLKSSVATLEEKVNELLLAIKTQQEAQAMPVNPVYGAAVGISADDLMDD
jgi:hypothetical protein